MAPTSPHIALPERYRLIRHVASGGMAAVYAADDQLLGRQVAVKVLSAAFSADPRARLRFTREARAAARVSDHPHVVTVYDIGEAGDDAFIVMELLPGGTLNDRLKRGEPIPHGLAVRWLREAASALDAAHRVDIVHRDVKPANLLLDGRGSVRVGDFGIATIATEASVTQTGQVVGTAAYLSPEQAMGRPATPASDRYALAVVAFELLTGRRPFTATHPTAQARDHVDTDPPHASVVAGNLPGAVDAVLTRGMAKAPAGRPATASGFVDALEAALGPTGATAVTEPRSRRLRPTAPPVGVAIPDPNRPETLRHEQLRPRRPAAGGAPPGEPARRRSRWAPLAVLLAIVVVAGAAVALLAGGRSTKVPATARHASTTSHRTAPAPAAPPATTAAPAATPTTAATAPSASDPSAVEAQAHSLIDAGSYTDAIGLLQPMLPTCPVATTDPCAYAFYDIAYALVKDGRASEAVPYLMERLKNPNQRGAVTALLQSIPGQDTGAGGAAADGAATAGGAPAPPNDAPRDRGRGGSHGAGRGGRGNGAFG